MTPDKRTTTTVGLTTDEIKKVCRGIAPNDREQQMLCVVQEELAQGFDFIKSHPKMITILGSARVPEGDFYYEKARELAYRFAKEQGMAVTTGGGPGIMEAANRGALEAGGTSLGVGIKLPMEQKFNQYVTGSMNFHFFFTRKVILNYTARAFIYFPGGYGTLDEFFEFLTLVQTKKVPPIPIYLYGSEYWQPILDFFRAHVAPLEYIDMWDEELFVVTDSIDDILVGVSHFIEG
jgi:uncharacterized protein (TIGR00730 family)